MASRPIFPPPWPALLRHTATELLCIFGLGALFIVCLLVPAFNSERSATTDRPGGVVVAGRLTLTQRLGYAILLNSGVADLRELADKERSDLLNQIDLPPWPVELSNDSLMPQCVADDIIKIGNEDLSLQALTLSIISAEMYNRDGIIRRAKFPVSDIYNAIFGKIPNFSYGVAQVKLETAKHILEKKFDNKLIDNDILELLRNDCDNASIAEQYVKDIIDENAVVGTRDDAIDKVASVYVGAERNSEGSRLYIESVLGAYYLLRPNDPATPETADAAGNVQGCVGFSRGRDSGKFDPIFADFLQSHPEAVHVSVKAEFWTDELKPIDYRAGLATARRKWLTDQLRDMGFDETKIEMADVNQEGDIARVLSGLDRCDLSFAKLTLDMPLAAAAPPPSPETQQVESGDSAVSAAPIIPAAPSPEGVMNSGRKPSGSAGAVRKKALAVPSVAGKH